MSVIALLVALLAVAGFAVALHLAGLFPLFRRLNADMLSGVSAMFDKTLGEDAQEEAVRRAGKQLIFGAWGIIWRFAAALAAAYAPMQLADWLGLVPLDAAMGVLLRVDFLLAVSVAILLLLWLLGRGSAAEATAGAGSYSAGDRIVHMLAFSSPGLQRLVARLDDKRVADLETAPPIFITSLARGGTTALLNALYGLPGVATHIYRDMPFVTAPILWSRLSGQSRQVQSKARAHGDGLEIDLDSPEAFDEILWMLHWPEKYSGAGIALWHEADRKDAARAFMATQFRKIATLRRPDAAGPVRYLSKNNANIARLRVLPQMFPGCDIVIPLRDPAAHAASLMRQHRNFLTQHAEDAFVRRYMADIGHFEFGALHRPLLFGNFPQPQDEIGHPDYWLRYWIEAFREVAAQRGAAMLVTQDDLRAAPQTTVTALLDRLGLQAPGVDFTGFFRDTPDRRPDIAFSKALLDEAEAIYEALAQEAVR